MKIGTWTDIRMFARWLFKGWLAKTRLFLLWLYALIIWFLMDSHRPLFLVLLLICSFGIWMVGSLVIHTRVFLKGCAEGHRLGLSEARSGELWFWHDGIGKALTKADGRPFTSFSGDQITVDHIRGQVLSLLKRISEEAVLDRARRDKAYYALNDAKDGLYRAACDALKARGTQVGPALGEARTAMVSAWIAMGNALGALESPDHGGPSSYIVPPEWIAPLFSESQAQWWINLEYSDNPRLCQYDPVTIEFVKKAARLRLGIADPPGTGQPTNVGYFFMT